MSVDYHPMWQELGLDLEAHDALLGVLGPLYAEVFLSQPRRPRGMDCFNIVMSEVHGLRIRELLDHKAQGGFVVGTFCTFVPEELVLAAGGICVGLCAGAEWSTPEVDALLPRTTCALIKGAFGFASARVCPYLAASDLVVGENTCDGKKKAWESFGRFVNDLHVMDMPQVKNEAGRTLLREQYVLLRRRFEALGGRSITEESLGAAIEVVNAKRRALARLQQLRGAEPAPISGLDALLIQQISFYDDPVRFTASVNALCDELESRVAAGQGIHEGRRPRLLMSGCPMAVPNWKLPRIVEEAGAVIVGEESCIGARGLRNLVEPSATTVEAQLDALTDRYLGIDCAIFTPNPGRLEHIREMSANQRVDGVIHFALPFCQPYQFEALQVEPVLEGEGLPVLRIDTDYSPEDAGQLATRVEAFLERLAD
ncbi:MAG: double-cubane-cluster-containing anaerobic reductase [bacterium]|nr:double-cubane-cluster-containing anaerobic reductase [bacterium]